MVVGSLVPVDVILFDAIFYCSFYVSLCFCLGWMNFLLTESIVLISHDVTYSVSGRVIVGE